MGMLAPCTPTPAPCIPVGTPPPLPPYPRAHRPPLHAHAHTGTPSHPCHLAHAHPSSSLHTHTHSCTLQLPCMLVCTQLPPCTPIRTPPSPLAHPHQPPCTPTRPHAHRRASALLPHARGDGDTPDTVTPRTRWHPGRGDERTGPGWGAAPLHPITSHAGSHGPGEEEEEGREPSTLPGPAGSVPPPRAPGHRGWGGSHGRTPGPS